jgi:hypothetical protein
MSLSSAPQSDTEEIMADALASPLLGLWGAICAAPQELDAGHHGLAGPILGDVLVAGAAGIVTLLCFVVALRLLISPGERDPHHPKYRILSADR